MKKFILGASALMVIFSLTFFAVPVLAATHELNGAEIGGRKIVVNKAISGLNGSEIGGRKIVVNKIVSPCISALSNIMTGADTKAEELELAVEKIEKACTSSQAKAVKEVMDVYDRMESRRLMADGTWGCFISEVAKSQNGDDIVLRKRPGRIKYSNLVLKQMTSSELLELCKSGSIILLGDDSQKDN